MSSVDAAFARGSVNPPTYFKRGVFLSSLQAIAARVFAFQNSQAETKEFFTVETWIEDIAFDIAVLAQLMWNAATQLPGSQRGSARELLETCQYYLANAGFL